MIRIADIAPCTQSEGPGKRFAIWVQGCSIGCPGCINPEMFDPEGGKMYSLEYLKNTLVKNQRNHDIRGVSILGGEPFDQLKGLQHLVELIKDLHMDLIIFTGYTFTHLRKASDHIIDGILKKTDALIDGPFLINKRVENLYLRGSSNQKVVLLSDVFHKTDFQRSNSVEFCIKGNELKVTGFPFSSMEGGLWNEP